MSFDYAILGAGRQGAAIAYGLARHGGARRVLLADADESVAQRAAARLAALLPDAECELVPVACDVSDAARVIALVRGSQVVVSAVPYRFNERLTDAAVAAGCSFCDLGGNTDVVRAQLKRHDRAVAAGVSIAPDCGLAPGLGNLLAAYGIARMDEPASVHVRCGGLPERPVGPLGYKMLFHFQGLINEYSGFGEFLRDGRPVRVAALTEVEPIEFPPPVGKCEAAVTSGGTSTAADSFLGRLKDYDYKTVRYPGHWAVMRALFGLGCFEERVTLASGEEIAPKALLAKLMEERLRFPEVRDVTVLRVTVGGLHGGKPATHIYELFDRHDEVTGFTAMERTTGFPTCVVAHLQARGHLAPGARPLELSVPLEPFMRDLAEYGLRISESGGGEDRSHKPDSIR